MIHWFFITFIVWAIVGCFLHLWLFCDLMSPWNSHKLEIKKFLLATTLFGPVALIVSLGVLWDDLTANILIPKLLERFKNWVIALVTHNKK